jgi:hypothetical protein
MLQLVAYQVYRGRTLLRTVLDVQDDGPVARPSPARHVADVATLQRMARELHAEAPRQ